jgi:hypothetical protein
MNRDDLVGLIEFAEQTDDTFQSIKNNIYSIDEEYDEDDLLLVIFSIEKLIENLKGMIGYVDEQVLLEELNTE